MSLWYSKKAPEFVPKYSKSIIHPFIVKGYQGLTINPYQGCQHRCGYCYASYDWSPEFYDKIYAKSNAPEVLEKQLKSWKYETIYPVMVSSATDAYQPAEIKYELTRRCIEILQKYDIPYYIFTKSTIISRDLKLHMKYKDSCFVIWSITTCDEKTRRLIEPGTPPASSIFTVIKKFVDVGIRCGVNIDPILPLITDSENNINKILDSCRKAGINYVFGAVLRLRSDIWERIKIILKLLNIKNGINEYKRSIYQFVEPLKPGYNIAANEIHSRKAIQSLEQKVLEKGMIFDFPYLIGRKPIKRNASHNNHNKNDNNDGRQLTIMSYM
jgi:DNA repair photolyase